MPMQFASDALLVHDRVAIIHPSMKRGKQMAGFCLGDSKKSAGTNEPLRQAVGPIVRRRIEAFRFFFNPSKASVHSVGRSEISPGARGSLP